MKEHAWTPPDDRCVSECLNGCGVFRVLTGSRNTHTALYSRARSLKDGTWGAVRPDCAPPVRAPEEA